MRSSWLPFLLLASSMLGQSGASPASTSTFPNALAAASAPLILTPQGELAGTGAQQLVQAIHDAQFVLIGESHFSRETPRLTAAICRSVHPDAYAVEAGPYATAFVAGLLHDPDRAARMQQRERIHPASMAFLNGEQENDLAADCIGSSTRGHTALWGLDQEFLGAASVLLEAMAAQRNGPSARAAMQAALAKDKQAEAQARSTGDATQLFLVSVPDADLAQLQAAVSKDGTPESNAILREWVVSRHIYRLNMAGSPQSNTERATLLKQHFLANYRELQQQPGTPAPRILLKFGDNNMWKGFNDTHQLDLGDYIAELASEEHTTSLHIQVLAARGTLANFGGYARPAKLETFTLADTPEYAWLRPVLDLLPPQSAGSGAQGVLIDLRKLRFRNLPLSAEWQRQIDGYDLLVMLPQFTPATFSP